MYIKKADANSAIFSTFEENEPLTANFVCNEQVTDLIFINDLYIYIWTMLPGNKNKLHLVSINPLVVKDNSLKKNVR